ncbi:MAG: type IV pilus twitching motility protein PilT, partial [Myxococcaceae bacterium]|nr:type IV pilus twitching motility protein PilT [Myxococcaceae bacterium]
ALLGRIAVHYKLISQEQLTAAAQRQAVEPRPLSNVLLELKFISSEQAKWLAQAQQQFLAKQNGGQAPAAAPAPAPAPAPAAAKPAPAPAPAPAAGPSAPAPAPIAAAAPAPVRTTSAPNVSRVGLPTLQQILTKAVESKASDVHIHSGAPLQMRVNGILKELKTGVLDPSMVEAILKDGLDDEQRERLNEHWDLDAAISLPGVGRFRASFYKQQRGWDGVFRTIPPNPPTLEQLGLPASLAKLTDFHQGLVLITGPGGCGKSSTMAALLSMLNASRQDHIITVEDPIEYVHTPQGCVVNQRQANKHTKSFANALRAALREDPDIIMIGELRDLETIQLAISAAETGHLVMGTLHTNNAIRTINRILDVFPPKQQSQIRAMVSESLRAIVSQRLVLSADGTRRIPVLEVLYVKPSVSNLIREEKTFQIRSIMQTGRSDGMCLLDDSLAELVKSGQVTKAEARRHAEDPKRFA